jgi:hypothetical protein
MTDNELSPLPPQLQRLFDDAERACRILLSNGRSPKKLRIRLDAYPNPDDWFEIQQTWKPPRKKADR